MPEGDTIFRAARTLEKALAGKRVTRFETGLAQLARVNDDAPLVGRMIHSVAARGKHLLMAFSGDLILRTHMRMNGSWHIYRPQEPWQRARARLRVLVGTEDFVAVGFDVPVAEFETARSLARVDDVRLLGPDLLAETFDVAEAKRRLLARGDTSVGEALLNQRVLAGVGNVFKSEVCFSVGVNPFSPVRGLTGAEVDGLLKTAEKFLRANILEGRADGVLTYTGMRRTTGRGDPTERLWVYGRSGKPCRKCATPIAFAKQGRC